MKRILIVIIAMLSIFITGCSVVRIDTSSIDNIISVVLTKDNKLFNQVGQGYKYYLPGGVTYIDSDEFNDVLYSNGVYYYLYVDAVNYYYQTDVSYKEDRTLYYSKYIRPNNKFKYYGYLEIREENDEYYIEFVYNYAKIEAIAPKSELNNVILNSSYILSTIKYNYDIIELMLKDDYFTNKTGIYNNYDYKDSSEKFVLKKEQEMKEG